MIIKKVEITAEEIQEIEQRNALSKELAELEVWFKEYDRITIEHSRCLRLGVECHHDIEELDRQAVTNSLRIKEIKQALAN